MPEEIEIEIENLKKGYPEFFSDSAEVIKFALSEGTASKIADICIKSGVEEGEKIGEVAYRITLALLGKLPKDKLNIALQYGAGLSPETAEKISSEANRLIFSQMPAVQTEAGEPAPEPPAIAPEEKPGKPPRKDIYHEPIE